MCVLLLLGYAVSPSAQMPVPSSGPQAAGPVAAHLPPLDRVLPPRAEAVYLALATRVDAAVAMDTVRLMAPLWRLAGNPAFEQSQQFIYDRLAAAGLDPHYESFPNTGMGWEMVTGKLRLNGPAG
jgi:hypothetical protein